MRSTIRLFGVAFAKSEQGQKGRICPTQNLPARKIIITCAFSIAPLLNRRGFFSVQTLSILRIVYLLNLAYLLCPKSAQGTINIWNLTIRQPKKSRGYSVQTVPSIFIVFAKNFSSFYTSSTRTNNYSMREFNGRFGFAVGSNYF